MRQKASKMWFYIIVSLILAVGVFVTGRNMLGFRNGGDKATPLLEEKTRTLEEKDRELQEMNIHMAQLREQLDNSSKQIAGLKAELDEANRTLFSARQKLTLAEQRIKLLEARSAPPPRERIAPPPEKITPPPDKAPLAEIPRRPAEPGTYEVIRATAVFERPSESAGRMATIDQGVRILVVGSVGEWLEVRSKHGNPSGFIRRDDAMFVGKAK